MVSEDYLEELTLELNISLLLIFPERVGFSLIKKKFIFAKILTIIYFTLQIYMYI